MKTEEYFHGLIDGLTILIIEIILLSITVPIIVQIVHTIRTRRLRATVDFYLFQSFHNITQLILNMASIDDIRPILEEEQKRNVAFYIESHFIYGNLDNKLFVLKKVLHGKNRFKRSLEKSTHAEVQGYLVKCNEYMDEMDRLIAMLSNLPKVQEEIFNARMLVYLLRGMIQRVCDDTHNPKTGSMTRIFAIHDLQEYAKNIIEVIETIFQKRKKLIDSILKHGQTLAAVWTVIEIPYIVLRRWILIPVCRIRREPYRDPYWSSYDCFLLREWREKNGFSIEKAAEVLEIPQNLYRDFEFGYRKPRMTQWDGFRKHLRGDVKYS